MGYGVHLVLRHDTECSASSQEKAHDSNRRDMGI